MPFVSRLALPLMLLAPAAIAAPVADPVPARILDEGLNRSQVMQTAAHLTDNIGGRMTNSPQMREAERWTQSRFTEMGLSNVRKQGFRFGRGWSIERSSVRMVTPRPSTLTAIPIAWTPATDGALAGEVIVAPLRRERDFAKWRGKLAGKIVMITLPDAAADAKDVPFQRLSGEELGKLDEFEQPVYQPETLERTLRRIRFPAQLDAFLKAEGARAWVRKSRRNGGLVHGEGSGFAIGETPALPGIELAAEDYRLLARLAKAGAAPTIEIVSDVRFHDEDPNAYNILADLPGSDAKAGYVMAGAHLDSWVAGDGATDNAAGSAVVMEAARILKSLGVRPRRTIRFALWSGEEQGILGSLAYVEDNFVSFPAIPGAETMSARERNARLSNAWPLTPKPGYRDLAAYFNLDNGSGRIRGIHAENNPAAMPIFREWLAPFASMGADTVAIQKTGGTDHVYMQHVGLPGFQFIQDPLDYESTTHHSNADSYDHLRGDDLRQASVIMATMLWKAANAPDPLPRPPLPSKPAPTDPFAYPDDSDD
ncbi:M20/M25/M40 family metallo-hydrolase [Sphingomonas sp. 1P06PA]|uniref:M20/M25/M40 family metallo-hydrolase n=1 Tax=Sphingomonas sp. 1P06PA TaxID=554121 RepID=UPI0039A41986